MVLEIRKYYVFLFFLILHVFFCRGEALKLLRNKNVNELHNKVYIEAAIQALSNSMANNLRLKMQISDLLRLVKPRFIIVAYEGYDWERLIF
jgi:hypothetical protein